MCEFKVGDKVRRVRGGKHDWVNVGDVVEVRGITPGNRSFTVVGSTYYFSPEFFELVERKVEPVKHVFKVGDKGLTRSGKSYEVVAVGVAGLAKGRSMVAIVDGYANCVLTNGRENAERESVYDLLPPVTYVWRIDLDECKPNTKSGLINIKASRWYSSEAAANQAIVSARNSYITIAGPFKEEKK